MKKKFIVDTSVTVKLFQESKYIALYLNVKVAQAWRNQIIQIQSNDCE